MPITSAATAGTRRYSAMLDGNFLLTIYGESDGAGGTQKRGIAIGTSMNGIFKSPLDCQYFAVASTTGGVIIGTRPVATKLWNPQRASGLRRQHLAD